MEDFLASVGTGIGVILTLLVRDWVRDKKFSQIREVQSETFRCKLNDFECRFTDERKAQLSEARDGVRDLVNRKD